MTKQQQAEQLRWALKAISRDAAARAGVAHSGKGAWVDSKHAARLADAYQIADLHARINRRAG